MPLVRALCRHVCWLRRPRIFSGRNAPMIHSCILMPQQHVTLGSMLLPIKSTASSHLGPSGTPIRLIMSLAETLPDPSSSLSIAHDSRLQLGSFEHARADTSNGKPLCPQWPSDRTYQRVGKTDAIDPEQKCVSPRAIVIYRSDMDHGTPSNDIWMSSLHKCVFKLNADLHLENNCGVIFRKIYSRVIETSRHDQSKNSA